MMSRQSRRSFGFLAFGSAVAGLAASPVQLADAQQATSGQLEEIVVTAQKRAENLKDVPSNVSVLGLEELIEHNITSAEDITRTTPSISFNAGGAGIGVGVGETNIEIRGVSSSSGAATVGVYFNDVSVTVDNKNGLGSPAPMMFDLSRIEVLRGPQGTLFGASSEGGTVRYIFNNAKLDDFSGEVTGEVSGTKHGGTNYQSNAVLNLPLIDNIAAVRINAGYESQSGWIDNYSLDGALLARGVNSNQTQFFRITATIQPSENVTLTPEFHYQQVHSDDSPVFYLKDEAYYLANQSLVPPPLATDGLYNQHKEVAEPSRDTVMVGSFTAAVNGSVADLTSVTSYYYRPYKRITDGTTFDSYIIAVDFLGLPPTDRTFATLASPVVQPVTYHTFSQELRLASHTNPGDALKWVAGLYYSDQSANYSNYDQIPGLSQTFQNVYGYGINSAQSPIGDPAVPNLYAGDYVYTEYGTYETRQYAIFGQVDYAVLTDLHASLGWRSTVADSSTTVTQGGFYALGNLGTVSKSDRYTSNTPKFSLVYDLDATSTAYASVGKGFRLGGELYTPLPVGPNNICSKDYATFGMGNYPSSAYDSDHLLSYELGTKGRALDNALSFDVAGYYLNWSNLQQDIYLPTCGYYDTINIGNAESYGAELEMRYKLHSVPGLTLGVTGGANHAVLTSSVNMLTAQPGQHILYTPRWSATASLDYEHHLAGEYDGFLSWDYAFTGPSNGSYQVTNPNYENPEYAVMNLTLGVRFSQWEVAAFARNLLNNRTVIQSPTVNSLVEGYAVQPLTAGLRVQRKF